MDPRLRRAVGLDEITQAEHWEMFAPLLPVGGTFQPGGCKEPLLSSASQTRQARI